MTSEFDRLFATAVTLLFAGYLLRCCLGGILLGAAHIPGRVGRTCTHLGEAVTPKLARRVVGGLLGALTVFSGISPALAVSSPAPIADSDHQSVVPQLDRGPRVGSIATAPQGARSIPPRPASGSVANKQKRGSKTVKVKAGDCLWRLAADQLGSAASDSEIGDQTERWYSTNRSVIGSDPDLIATGSRLTVPGDAR
jgi:hypothetical protein